ncbi:MULTISPECIES: DUF397 domain-containing protein [Streptomyces]|uniref:DUF397 domain-containing protein n=1 Tax=Streptomyces TaxID=1883 RepID=UPI001678CD6B|nr:MULTISPECIES: DUF397 domain-containing protein [Streptomyces]MBK3521856.1 DUF397 domain-containing protein [Streptomyces sp. MBT70]GGR79272.1 hypothetical protein GCM10010236_37420 [Streptomyces eurythermus]
MVSNERTIPNSAALTGWYKSSYSDGSQSECLEVARGHADVPVRDSKAVTGPALLFSANGWTAFVSALKKDQLLPGQ